MEQIFVLNVLSHSSLLMSSSLPAHLVGGVANQNVETPKLRHRLPNQGLADRFVGHVARAEQRTVPDREHFVVTVEMSDAKTLWVHGSP
jgi:hypothetical protein